MDILKESKGKNEKTKTQKIILSLLFISIVLCIGIVILLYLMKDQVVKPEYSISLNNSDIAKEKIGLLQTEDGKQYISIKAMCSELGYNYFNGEYNEVEESKDRGYFNNDNRIVQFYANSNKIFKTYDNGENKYEYYDLENNIIQYNEGLYICLEDVNIGFNLLQSYNEINNKTEIQTPENWLAVNKESIETLGYKIPEPFDNFEAIAYGYIIVKNNDKYGVLNLSGEEIIGTKYNDMSFIEYTKQFIVSNSSDKYGIINDIGTPEIKLQYDDIKILNYDPLLYQVESQKKYGVIKKDGSLLSEINYDSIGYPEKKSENIIYTLIIPALDESIPESIVVCENGLYGLIDINNGKTLIPCSLKGIFLYVDIERNFKDYVVQLENESYLTLTKYITSLNKMTVNVNS